MRPNLSNLLPALLGLGSNLGDRQENLRSGLRKICDVAGVRLIAVSSIYESEPIDCDGGPFLNAVALVETSLDPYALLDLAKKAERAAGRTGSKGDARPLDIDILFYSDLVLNDSILTIPHPKVFERAFVVAPLREVCAGLRNPISGRRIFEEAEAAAQNMVLPKRFGGDDWWR